MKSDIIPSYLYQQYADDDALQAFVISFNSLAQGYLNWFNRINLPVYSGPEITGPLLDWVGEGIYGIRRPTLTSGTVTGVGPLNTWDMNTMVLNKYLVLFSGDTYKTSDDAYKRILTWYFYKGDGFIITMSWLKRRVYRFLYGLNGTDVDCSNLETIDIKQTTTVTIDISNAPPIAVVFQAAVQSRLINLPFQFNFIVNLV